MQTDDLQPYLSILQSAKTIAIVGLSPKPERDSHHVAQYLQEQGYRIVPINPSATEILGERSWRAAHCRRSDCHRRQGLVAADRCVP